MCRGWRGGQQELRGAGGFFFLFCFSFFSFLHTHSRNSCFDTRTRGKNITSPTSSCLFLIFFSFPLPLHSSHDFYFPSLVFPSVWPNGLPPYIFPHLVPSTPFFSPFSTSASSSPSILLSLIVDIAWKFQIAPSLPHLLITFSFVLFFFPPYHCTLSLFHSLPLRAPSLPSSHASSPYLLTLSG